MTTATTPDTLRLNKLEIESFLRVRALRVDLEGRHLVLSGPNGSGKTSVLNAIWYGLTGVPASELPEPIHQGEDEACVRQDLGEYVIERRWNRKGMRLVVTAADGSPVRKPQQLLDGLLSRYALDPVAFLERSPREQLEDLLAVAGVPPPVQAAQEAVGDLLRPADLVAAGNESADAYLERLAGEDRGIVYCQRRESGRLWERKRAELETARKQLAGMGGPPGDAEEDRGASELTKELVALNQKADERRAVQAEAVEARQEFGRANARLQELRQTHARQDKECQRISAQIAELHQLLAERTIEAKTTQHRIENGSEYVAEAEKDADAKEAAAALLADPYPRISQVTKAIEGATQTAALRHRRQHAAEQVGALAGEEGRLRHEHGRLDKALGQLRALRSRLLDGADLGVEGLAVGAGELRLNGLPLRQASMAEQIRVACGVAMRQQPRLRLLRLDNAEHLDAASKRLVLELAEANGWQVVMTSVADTEGLRVEIVEGKP